MAAEERHGLVDGLEQAAGLRLLANNHMTTQQMKGSWAGAMGNMQFMPSTFTKWATCRSSRSAIRATASGVAALRLNAPGTVLMLPTSLTEGNNAARMSASSFVYSSRASSPQSGR